MQRVHPLAAAVLCLLVMVPLTLSGCGGGDGDGVPFGVEIIACDATTYASKGVVCIDYRIVGRRGVFALLPQFIAGPSGPLEEATEIPPALEQQLGVSSSLGGFGGFGGFRPGDPPTKNFSFLGRFCWFAGADLGYIATPGVQFFLTPVSPGSNDPVGDAASCPPFNYGGGGMTQFATGPGIGNMNGRAGHCAEHVVDKTIVIAGGYTNVSGTDVAYDTFDRLTFDTANFTYSKNNFPLLMQNARRDHACAFFMDPSTGAIKVLAAGGSDLVSPAPSATADVYCFTPVEQVSPTNGTMTVPRAGHTATWIPSNQIVIIGGANQGGPLGSIEVYNPVTDMFTASPTVLAFPRSGHTATLLPTGKILIAGGVGVVATTPLAAELFDPETNMIMTVPGPFVDRVAHTATRLANGWVLLAGGYTVTSNQMIVTSSTQIFQPELGAMGGFTVTMPMMTSPRAYHAASLLGDGNALYTGGEINTVSVTQTAEIFLDSTLTFTPIIPMMTARAEHTSNATDCGSIVVIGGRTGVGAAATFLNSVEIYPIDNANPVVASAFLLPGSSGGTADLHLGITDEDADGGYVIVRYRTGSGMFLLPTITQQMPSSAPAGFPNMQVSGLPAQEVAYVFSWNYTADGLTAGTPVQIEIIPVGATLGDAELINAVLP